MPFGRLRQASVRTKYGCFGLFPVRPGRNRLKACLRLGDNGLEIVLHAEKKNGPLGLDCGFCLADQFLEGIRFVNGKLGDDLAVQLDASLGQSMHELAVTDSLGTAGCIDPDDPKLTEFRFVRLRRWE